MCLSTVYKKTEEENIFLLKNIAYVRNMGDTLIFTDLMGVRTEIEGSIIEVDLMDNKILISAK